MCFELMKINKRASDSNGGDFVVYWKSFTIYPKSGVNRSKPFVDALRIYQQLVHKNNDKAASKPEL